MAQEPWIVTVKFNDGTEQRFGTHGPDGVTITTSAAKGFYAQSPNGPATIRIALGDGGYAHVAERNVLWFSVARQP